MMPAPSSRRIRGSFVSCFFLAALVAACGSGGGDSPAAGGDGEIKFHGEQQPLSAFSFDTGLQPPASPVQMALSLTADSKLVADASAIASGSADAPTLTGEAGSGAFTMDVHFKLAGRLKVALTGLPSYDGAIPGMSSMDLAFGDHTTFDPFLLAAKASLVAQLPETKLPPIPLPGGIPGEIDLTVQEGSTVTSNLAGTCAAVSSGDSPRASYLARTTTHAHLVIKPTIVVHVPVAGDKSFPIPPVTVDVPDVAATMDLGTRDVTTFASSAPDGEAAKVGSCEAVAGDAGTDARSDAAPTDSNSGTDSGVGSDSTTTTNDSSTGSDGGVGSDSSTGDDGGVTHDGGSTCVCGDGVCRAGCETAASCPADCGELVFDKDDARRTTSTGDWAIGDWKAECSTTQAMTGISTSCYGLFCGAHAALCTFDWASTYEHQSCHAVDFGAGDVRETTSTGDWAVGLHKGECGTQEYVAGYGRDPSGQVTRILCCNGAVEHKSCVAHSPYGGDSRESTASGDWSPTFTKAECAPGRYVAGAASNSVNGTWSILCCTP